MISDCMNVHKNMHVFYQYSDSSEMNRIYLQLTEEVSFVLLFSIILSNSSSEGMFLFLAALKKKDSCITIVVVFNYTYVMSIADP